jgi:hypothetical protein
LPVSIANSGTDVGQLADNVWMDTEYICKVWGQLNLPSAEPLTTLNEAYIPKSKSRE